MILPLVNFVKDMRIVLSEVDIFRIFVKYLRNEKKHMCNSSSRKKYDHLESEFTIVIMQRIEPNSYGYLIKHINVLRNDIFTLERSMFRNFYFQDEDYLDILQRSCSFGQNKKGLSAEYAASKHFLICICLMFVCSISSFPKQLLVHSFINWDLRLNMQQVNGVSSSFVFSVRYLFISISANHNKLRKHLTAHLRFSRGIINFPERYNQLVNGV